MRVHTDMRGNVSFLLDASGNGVERYTYDAFGLPTITDWYGNVRSTSAYGNGFLFQGREYLSELGIYDFRNRMYHPALGRFLQPDPLGFGGGDANLFRFCGGDPVNGSDPTGLYLKMGGIQFGGAVFGGVSISLQAGVAMNSLNPLNWTLGY